MSLETHAREELHRAGLFDKDSGYGGMLGDGVLELVKVFAAQGHSGHSAGMTIAIFKRVANYELLTPLENPTKTGLYIDHGKACGGCWQSTRDSKVFSDDQGKTWYHLDKHRKWWQRALVAIQYAWPLSKTSFHFPNRWLRGRISFTGK